MTQAPGASPSWSPAVSVDRDRQLISLLAPLSIGLLASRLYKTVSVTLLVEAAAGHSLRRVWVQLSAIAVLSIIAVVSRRSVGRALSRLGLGWGVASGVIVTVVGVAVAASRIVGQPGGFLDRWVGRLLLLLQLFREDVSFLLGFGLVALVVASLRPGTLRTSLVWALRVAVTLILVLAGLDLAYFRVTGLNGDVFAVHFVLANAGSMGFLLRSAVNWGNVAVVASYAALLPASTWLAAKTKFATTLQGPEGFQPQALFAPLTLGIAVWIAPSHYLFNFQYQQVSTQLDVALLADLLEIRTVAAAPASRTKTRLKPLADWSHLAFTRNAQTKSLNVVVIILESTRARSVTPYNPKLKTTPFLADLATRSLLIEDMNAVIPQTSKAWTAVLTGLHPVTTTLANWSFVGNGATAIPSLPRLLKPHGYVSAFFTPAHLKFDNDLTLVKARGFDVVRSDGDYDSSAFERTNYYGFEDRILLRPTLSWIDEVRSQGKPFFLTLMTLTGHHDYKVPSSFPKVTLSSSSDVELNDYLNALHYIDGFLRDLFAGFETRGLLDSTLFIVVGDHGQSFGEHGARQHHGVLFDEALRIPGLLYCPQLWSQPGRILGPRQQIDVLPTVADALGFEITGGYMPGASLLRPVPDDRTLFFMDWHDNAHLALRRGAKKYIYTFSGSLLQSFDLKSDPLELRDLAPALSKVEASKLQEEMFDWQQRVNESFLPTSD